MQKNIFLTGRPGTGKTTLIYSAISALGEKGLMGFYTEEIRAGNTRLGFKVKALSGPEGLLAHVDVKSPHRVGKYGVDVTDFERVAIPAIDGYNMAEVSIIVIDEIGKMESFSERFKRKVIECLDSPKRVLATIALKGDAFINSLKKRPDVTLIQITEKNRDQLRHAVIRELAK